VKKYGARGQLSDPPQLGESIVVLAFEAEDAINDAYQRGYKEAEEFYTNSCMLCGYVGQWSTYICDDCIKEKCV
jgi:hypothetical protein